MFIIRKKNDLHETDSKGKILINKQKLVKGTCAHNFYVGLYELVLKLWCLLQKHQRKSIARKCNKCAMWFVHKGILKEHHIKDHSSFKGVPGTFFDNFVLGM